MLTVMQPGMWGQGCHASTCGELIVLLLSHAWSARRALPAIPFSRGRKSIYLEHADCLVHRTAILACCQLQARRAWLGGPQFRCQHLHSTVACGRVGIGEGINVG